MSATSALGGNAPVITSASSVIDQISNVSQQIAGISAQIRATGDAIRALVAELQAHQETKPTHPGPDADKDALKLYNKQLEAWQAKATALQDSIGKLGKAMERLGDQLSQAMDKLDDLKNLKLPAAQEEDRRRAEKQAEDAAKQMEAIGKEIEKQVEKLDDPALLAKVQWKTIELKRSTNTEDLEGLSLKDVIRTFSVMFAALPETNATKGGKNVYTGASAQAPAIGLPGLGSGEPAAVTADEERKVDGVGAAS